ncbi:MAG: hypothetical protein AAFR35_11375 [Pseudomonadota bacterium]
MERSVITLTPHPARRWFGIAVLGALAVLLLYLALIGDGVVGRMALALAGAGSAWAAVRLHAATSVSLVLTQDALTDTEGTTLCRIEDIRKVDRGGLAFKPSNGFLLHVRNPGPRRWLPGLWWRVGRFIGVGGVTPAGATRFMAEMIAEEVARRETP